MNQKSLHTESEGLLGQVWPDLLNRLDRSPDSAMRDFHDFAYRLVKVKPPRVLRSLTESEKEDFLQDFMLHCVDNDFGVLRQYSDNGKPFSAWLYVSIHNRCLDFLKKKKRAGETFSPQSDQGDADTYAGAVSSELLPQERAEFRDIIDATKKCISRLGQYCQLLLHLAADEYTPREMVLAMGLATDKNKKISDDLRDCRKKLRKAIAERGIDPKSILTA